MFFWLNESLLILWLTVSLWFVISRLLCDLSLSVGPQLYPCFKLKSVQQTLTNLIIGYIYIFIVIRVTVRVLKITIRMFPLTIIISLPYFFISLLQKYRRIRVRVSLTERFTQICLFSRSGFVCWFQTPSSKLSY